MHCLILPLILGYSNTTHSEKAEPLRRINKQFGVGCPVTTHIHHLPIITMSDTQSPRKDNYGTFTIRGQGFNKKQGDYYAQVDYDSPGPNKNTYFYYNKTGSLYRRNPDFSSDYITSDKSVMVHTTAEGDKIVSSLSQTSTVSTHRPGYPYLKELCWIALGVIAFILSLIVILLVYPERKEQENYCRLTEHSFI